jgi:uncharacterized glyoxalase superfamily protein PhnB
MPRKVKSPIPEGMNTVTATLAFRGDCVKALELYPRAFGAKVVYPAEKTPDGKVMHAMIKIGDSNIMLSDSFAPPDNPAGLKSILWLYVKDCDAFYNKAVAAGCSVAMPLADAFWGDRLGQVTDPFGHTWNIASRKWVLTPKEMKAATEEWLKTGKM